ncbi:MAG TPA: hypothetical protein VJ739_08405, partial [Gemmataceae bacterium]|nr:hypothetical protein [Gemmataceae bacterium]
IPLEEGHVSTAYALLPPHGALKVPLLALATHAHGQPRLAIYDANSGALLRQLTGHVERIDSLAFSADGRLLVSAAEDQTVRVWSLTDIGDVLGRRGGLPRVRVKQGKGGLVVTQGEADRPDKGKLREGDVLVGLVERGKLRRLDSPLAFFGALFHTEPGRKVTLRRGDPAGNDDVTLTVGQGADERKPLFSLFAIRPDRGDKVEDADWIGWNPIGPYESSSPRAERFLGWHFNTGDPKAPTRFALAAAHQKDYYRPGILQKLIAKGRLDRVERLPPARPELVLLVEEAEQLKPVGRAGPLVVKHPHVTLKLEVRDRPLGELEALTWKLDGGAERQMPLDGSGAGEFAVPLELGRGDHQVIVTATTRDRPAQAVPAGVALRYQPPKPRVEREGDRGQRFVKEAAFDLKALVRPGLAEEPVTVAVHQWHDGKDLLAESKTYTIDPAKPLVIDRRLELRPGNNVLEVVAVNRNAPRDRQAEETDRLALEVFYVQKARPPVITLTGLKLPGNDNVLEVEPSQPVIVHAPVVTLLGKVEATENLADVERRQGDAAAGTRLAGFEPGKGKEFPLAEKLALQPGAQTFRIRARTATSDTAERSLTVEYRPLLPTVSGLKIAAPQPGDTVYGEAPTATVRLEGRVVLPADRQPYRAVVLVNGKEAAAAPVVDDKAGTLTAAVAIGPGDNYLRVRLSNAWGMVAEGKDEVHVRYLRPPRILEVKRVQADGKPVLNLEARVRSPLPLLAKSVRVEVNGQDVPAVKVQVQQPEDGVGLLRLQEVPLEAGSKENRVAVRVSNAEAECRAPGTITVETATVLPPPLVEILEPGRNADVSRPELPVSYRIRSASPLTAARLIVEGQPPLALDVTKAVRDDDARQLELAGEAAVTLARGFNHLRLEA